jgi:hypothetical protein
MTSRASLAASGCSVADATIALVSFPTVGASASAFLDRVFAILTFDETHEDLPERPKMSMKSDISLGRKPL